MLPEQILAYGKTRSCIRELSEYGARRKAEIGADKVYDYSLGNPSVPPPPEVDEAIRDILMDSSISPHAYTTAAGLPSLRKAIADDLNKRFDIGAVPELIYVTAGACPAIIASLKAIIQPGDEVACLAPFFPEYRVFVESSGGVLRVVPPAPNFRVDINSLRRELGPKVRALIINSPNNPTGAILTEDDIKGTSEVLTELSEKRGESVYLISDEPYREIVYGVNEVTPVFKHYPDSIMCYSFSKSLSIPGERLGYVAINPRAHDAREIYFGVMGASRAIGHVNPPSLFQRVVERTVGLTSDIAEYEEARRLLTEGLSGIGYEYVEPDGAFYLFVKALEPDALAFSEKAKDYELLLVPSDDFGCPGYVRLAYCVDKNTILNSMPAFKALFDSYTKAED